MAEIRLEDLKGNSNAGKRSSETRPAEEPKMRKVAQGQIVKKSAGKRFIETFIKEDAENIKDYIIKDVLVPTIVDTFIDICESTIEMLFRGERTSGYRRNGYSSSGKKPDKASYQAYYQSDRRNNKPYEASGSSSYPVKEILIRPSDTKSATAIIEEIWSELGDQLQEYGHIKVRELYECAGITSTDFTDNNYGWTSMRGFGKRRVNREDYILIVPPAEPV